MIKDTLVTKTTVVGTEFLGIVNRMGGRTSEPQIVSDKCVRQQFCTHVFSSSVEIGVKVIQAPSTSTVLERNIENCAVIIVILTSLIGTATLLGWLEQEPDRGGELEKTV